MKRRFYSNLVNIKPSWKLRHRQTTVEDRSRHYDFDDASVQWRSGRSSVDRQCLSTSTELQLRDACALLSQRIKYPDQWKDFDCSTAAAEYDQRTSSHYVDIKSPSFAVPKHITPGPRDEHINQEQNMFSSKSERREVYRKDKYDSGIGMEFEEDASDHAFDGLEQSTALEAGDMDGPSLSELSELRAQIHHPGEARRETIIGDEPATSHANQHIPPTSTKPKETPPPASSSSTTTTITAQRQSTQADIDPLCHTEPLTSTSTASAAITDTNGLERVLTIDEEAQRRMALEQAVTEKISSGGGVIAPAPNTDKDAALRSNPPTRMATANGGIDGDDGGRASKGELEAKWGMREGHQTGYALVKKLSKLGFGRKKAVAGGSTGMGDGDGAVVC